MVKIHEMIERLEKFESKYGNVEVNVYLSFSKKTINIMLPDIDFDDNIKDVYIGVYG